MDALLQRGTACDYHPLQCAVVQEGNLAVTWHLIRSGAQLRYRIKRMPSWTTDVAQYQREHENDHRNTSPLVLAMQQVLLKCVKADQLLGLTA